jgi:hypothetical protein
VYEDQIKLKGEHKAMGRESRWGIGGEKTIRVG